ncbi:AaceriAFR700Wp [[Ashbya] aceris (nom. inval.)]|nr:AaceriAFR700Wp [[Ashbya] aceris (nom. inval.)]
MIYKLCVVRDVLDEISAVTSFPINHKMKPALLITVSSFAAAIAMQSVAVQDYTEVATSTRLYKSRPKPSVSGSSSTAVAVSSTYQYSTSQSTSSESRQASTESGTFHQDKPSSQSASGVSQSTTTSITSRSLSIASSIKGQTSRGREDAASATKVSVSSLYPPSSEKSTDAPKTTPGYSQLPDRSSQLEKSKAKPTIRPTFSGYRNVTTSVSSTTGTTTKISQLSSTSSGSTSISAVSSSTTNVKEKSDTVGSTTTEKASSSKSSKTSSVPSSSAASSTGMSVEPAVATELVKAHNAKRALHEDTPPLKWNDELSKFAYKYVSSLAGTSEDPCSYVLKHSDGPYGENIASGFSPETPNVTDYVNAWYNEIEDYDYNNITGIYHDGKQVGHFTQVVWAKSEEVGCAVVYCSNKGKGIYVLCEYTPAGNTVDSTPGKDKYRLYKENVKPLKKR